MANATAQSICSEETELTEEIADCHNTECPKVANQNDSIPTVESPFEYVDRVELRACVRIRTCACVS